MSAPLPAIRRPRLALPAALCLAALAGPGAGPAAADEASALGRGTVYLAQTGPLAQVVPGAKGLQPVLALEIRRAADAARRLIVPGTEGPEVEASPFLVVEPASETLFLVWHSRAPRESAMLKLTRFDGEEWGEVLEIRDNLGSEKSSPQVWVTRDTYQLPGAGETRVIGRAVLHVIWWEESLDGEDVYYKPLVLVDGAYAGSHPALRLADLDADTPEPGAPAVARALYRAPRLQAGRTDHAVVVSFANPLTYRLATVEVAVLSGELSRLADDARSHIIGTGARPADLEAVAEAARTGILGTEARIHRGVVRFLGDVVRSHIIGTGARFADDAQGLARSASAVLMDEGAQMLEDSVADGPAGGSPRLVTLAEVAPGAEGLPRNHLRLRLLAARPLPPSSEAPTTIHVSPDGRAALVAWRYAQQIRYRESLEREWSPLLRLELGAQLAPEEAARILERRAGR